MSTLPAPAPAKRILPVNWKSASVVILAFTVAMYLVEAVDGFLHHSLDADGIVPRSLSGLDGIVWAPMLHGGWGHLFANTLPVLIFGFLVMAGGLTRWIAVTALIWVVSGVGVWLTGATGTSTIGASGLAFGWLAFLLVRGLFNRSLGQIVIAALLLLCWGGTLWGILPGNPGISWQAHLFGAIGGILAAWLAARADRPKAKAPGGTVEA